MRKRSPWRRRSRTAVFSRGRLKELKIKFSTFMPEKWKTSRLPPVFPKEIADEFVGWSTKAANYHLAASLPIYLFARFAP